MQMQTETCRDLQAVTEANRARQRQTSNSTQMPTEIGREIQTEM